MSWKSAPEVRAWLHSQDNLEPHRQAFCLREYVFAATYSADFVVPDEIAAAIVPTQTGEHFLSVLLSTHPDIPRSAGIFALLAQFFYQDILVDAYTSNLETIRSKLEVDLLSNRIRFPYIFGRLLYDRFNDSVNNDRPDHVEAGQVPQLLEGTPQGVYQMGNPVSGPLGFVESQESRYLPPTNVAPLWHCSDTGCNALHFVTLLPTRIPATLAFDNLNQILKDNLGPPSDWHIAFKRLCYQTIPTSGRDYNDLPVLIGDAIVAEERAHLLIAALKSEEGSLLRGTVGSAPRRKRVAEGSAEDVAGRLSEAEQFQLLLMLPNRKLIRFIDRAVWNRTIKIPVQEVRRANIRPPRRSSLDRSSQLSALGVRANREKAWRIPIPFSGS
jgi:hypothetical protein